ncbi:MAG: PHB depolymerase family esterase [Chitinophagaceae bacterium]
MKLPYIPFLALLLVSGLQFACKKDSSGFIDKPDTPVQDSIPVKPDSIPPVVPPQEIIETRPAILSAVKTNVIPNCQGFYKAVPARYDSTTKKYPLLIFIHGLGELGDGTTQLDKVLVNGTPRLLKNKTFPPNFVSGNTNYSFIVIAPQFKAWPSGADVNSIIDYAVANYRVDATRIYVSGLSMGGGATWTFATAYPAKAAAIVPICGAQGASTANATKIAKANLAVWAFHNTDDPTVAVLNTNNWIQYINNSAPSIPAKKTIWATGGHNAWTKATDPAYKENNMNMYEWMLQYHQ